MEFLKNISLFKDNLLDCFEESGYKGEIIGVYNPRGLEIRQFINKYQGIGFEFLIFEKGSIDSHFIGEKNIKTDFRDFYKKIDLFMINSLSDYHLLIEDLAGMQEKIFIFKEE